MLLRAAQLLPNRLATPCIATLSAVDSPFDLDHTEAHHVDKMLTAS